MIMHSNRMQLVHVRPHEDVVEKVSWDEEVCMTLFVVSVHGSILVLVIVIVPEVVLQNPTKTADGTNQLYEAAWLHAET